MEDCFFCKIVKREIPKVFAYEDENVIAFDDIHPVAPTHILIIPKEHIKDFVDVTDNKIYLSILKAAKSLIGGNELNSKGYKLAVNGGGAQDIFHLHFHLIGPRKKGMAV